jgi:hypothetical protein
MRKFHNKQGGQQGGFSPLLHFAGGHAAEACEVIHA